MNGHYSARDTHWAQKLSAAPTCTRTLSTRVVRHLQLKSNQRRVEEQPSAGTENVLLAVGLGAACRLARDHPCTVQLEGLTAYFWTRLRARMGDRIALNGHRERRLPNTLNVGFRGQIGQELLDKLDGVAASTGSACHSGSFEMSPVLQSMGCDPEIGLGAVRFSVGRPTTEAELDLVLDQLERRL